MSSDLEAQQEGLDDEYGRCPPAPESQEDTHLDSEGVIHEDSPQVEREGDGEDGCHMLESSQADIGVESVIPEAQLEKPEEELFNKEEEIHGDELRTGPDNSKKILVVPRV